MTELELDTVAVRVSGPRLAGDTFLGALILEFPESSEGPFPEWTWSWAPESSSEWTGRINVRTSASHLAPPPVPEEAVVCLAGSKSDVEVVEQVLTSWFRARRDVIDPDLDTYEVCLRLTPRDLSHALAPASFRAQREPARLGASWWRSSDRV